MGQDFDRTGHWCDSLTKAGTPCGNAAAGYWLPQDAWLCHNHHPEWPYQMQLAEKRAGNAQRKAERDERKRLAQANAKRLRLAPWNTARTPKDAHRAAVDYLKGTDAR